ncbi:MAG: hypothetical protein QM813_20635 [Verrucomicrobiota bacterium]
MNDAKLEKLFAATRKETPPAPEAGFDKLVLAAIRSEPKPESAAELSWFDQIGIWSPRLAVACAVVILVSVATDFALNALGVPSLTEGVAQISNDWLITFNAI